MSQLQEKVNKSIERLKAFEPPEGYYLAFSGGKDSVVCKALLDMSGCKYDATYHVTSVDPPELVRFIKEKHPDVKREVPRYSETIAYEKNRGKVITMWNLIEMKLLPPTRVVRYCCHSLKEHGGELIGVPTFYPSSQLCSNCGYKNPIVRDLKVRDWTCPKCGTHLDRDINAGQNILKKGLESLKPSET